MAKYFGSDVSKNSLGIAMCRYFKPDAQRVKDCADAGGDPKTINLLDDAKDGRKCTPQLLITITPLHKPTCTIPFGCQPNLH
jgi:hypothetical protein